MTEWQCRLRLRMPFFLCDCDILYRNILFVIFLFIFSITSHIWQTCIIYIIYIPPRRSQQQHSFFFFFMNFKWSIVLINENATIPNKTAVEDLASGRFSGGKLDCLKLWKNLLCAFKSTFLGSKLKATSSDCDEVMK